MKRPQQSRVSCVKKTEPSSTETSIASIQSGGAPPADHSSTGVSNGSTETTETAQNQDTERDEGSSTVLIDPQNASYFIQYQPEIAEKFTSLKTNTYSVSGRCLSIVFSRMLYWSRYAKHRHNGKLFYWKNQTELSQETGFSVKQINRALKVLVEMGLIIREKFMKHRYFQCYFYHIPVSPFTREQPKQSSSRSIRSNRTSTSGSAGVPQRFHSTTHTPTSSSTDKHYSKHPPQTTGAGSVAPNAPAAAVGAAAARRKIGGGIGFGRKEGKCPIHSTITPTLIKHSLKSIVDRCNFIGKYGIEDINRN